MIEAYQTETVTRVSATRDQWNTPGSTTEQSVRARVDRQNRIVRDYSGNEVYSEGSLLVTERPQPEDQYKFDGRTHSILKIEDRQDWNTRFYEVFVA